MLHVTPARFAQSEKGAGWSPAKWRRRSSQLTLRGSPTLRSTPRRFERKLLEGAAGVLVQRLFVRTIGIARAGTKIGLAIVYNVKRLIVLERWTTLAAA